MSSQGSIKSSLPGFGPDSADLREEHAAPPIQEEPTDPGVQSHVCAVGQLVASQFEVKELVAFGGMGEVYRVSWRGKEFALKVMRRRWQKDPIFRHRFFSEGELLKGFDHDGIVKVFQTGESEEVGPYFVMELLRGRTIAQVLQGGPLPPLMALSVAVEVANALKAVHLAKVIHRDLKPCNLFIHKEENKQRRIKILDFGVMKAEGALHVPTTREKYGMVTIRYASPEMLGNRPVGPASDLYALATILYEMLTGVSLFGRRAETAPDELYAAFHFCAPRVPLREVMSDSLDDVWEVIEKATRIDPSARYASAEEMKEALEVLCAARENPRASLVRQLVEDKNLEAAIRLKLNEAREDGGKGAVTAYGLHAMPELPIRAELPAQEQRALDDLAFLLAHRERLVESLAQLTNRFAGPGRPFDNSGMAAPLQSIDESIQNARDSLSRRGIGLPQDLLAKLNLVLGTQATTPLPRDRGPVIALGKQGTLPMGATEAIPSAAKAMFQQAITPAQPVATHLPSATPSAGGSESDARTHSPHLHDEPSDAVFVFEGGGFDGMELPILKREMRIGRNSDDVILDGEGVSRLHCLVTYRSDGTVELRDNKSGNGTEVNGQRVERVTLHNHDRVQIGDTVLIFRQGGLGDPRATVLRRGSQLGRPKRSAFGGYVRITLATIGISIALAGLVAGVLVLMGKW